MSDNVLCRGQTYLPIVGPGCCWSRKTDLKWLSLECRGRGEGGTDGEARPLCSGPRYPHKLVTAKGMVGVWRMLASDMKVLTCDIGGREEWGKGRKRGGRKKTRGWDRRREH